VALQQPFSPDGIPNLANPAALQFIYFGVDPDFNNCIDGLVLVDVSLLKPTCYRRDIEPHLGMKDGNRKSRHRPRHRRPRLMPGQSHERGTA
jgi:hypothetical protein